MSNRESMYRVYKSTIEQIQKKNDSYQAGIINWSDYDSMVSDLRLKKQQLENEYGFCDCGYCPGR